MLAVHKILCTGLPLDSISGSRIFVGVSRTFSKTLFIAVLVSVLLAASNQAGASRVSISSISSHWTQNGVHNSGAIYPNIGQRSLIASQDGYGLMIKDLIESMRCYR